MLRRPNALYVYRQCIDYRMGIYTAVGNCYNVRSTAMKARSYIGM